MLQRPLSDLDAWVGYLSQEPIPVLRGTAEALDALRQQEETVTGRQVTAVVLQDPLMTLRLLVHIEGTRRLSQNADITTIDRAVMMLGITPFFRRFENLPLVEETLARPPEALKGLLAVIARARQASLYARDWAVFRHDLEVEEIRVAALLRDASEILMWCFAPTLMMQVRALQRADPTLRSGSAQQAVLGVRLRDLQLALARAWHLPQLLQSLMDPGHAGNARVRTVALAVNLARHAQNGWGDLALPDDYAQIGKLLNLSGEAVLERIAHVAQPPPPTTQDGMVAPTGGPT